MTGASDTGLTVSRETEQRLQKLGSLVRKWNPAINLVAKSTLPDLRARHITDSLQLAALCPPDARTWVDLGSGGGFPGLVVAAWAAEHRPGLSLCLVESDQRKATFLRLAAQDMGLSVRVLSERIEDAPPQNADVLSARALAPLGKLCAFAMRHLAPGGTAILPKGAQAEAEIAAARRDWSFDLETATSLTEGEAKVLILRNLAHV